MKKLDEPIRFKLPPLRLYKTEVVELFNLINSNCKDKASLIICNHELEDISELELLSESKTYSLELQSYDPYILISLRNYQGSIYCGSSGILEEGVVSKAKNILLRGKALHLTLLGTSFLSHILLSTVCLAIIGLIAKIFAITSTPSLILLALLVYMLVYLPSYILNFHKYNIIYLCDKSSAANFFHRNRDSILLLLIGSIAGSAVTKSFDFVQTKLQPTSQSSDETIQNTVPATSNLDEPSEVENKKGE